MTGILIVTHERLGDALIDAAEFILEDRPGSMESVSINLNENPDKLRSKIKAGIKLVKDPDGVLIMTDMFGGTPSNLSYSFLDEGRVEVISGVNLPMVIKAASARDKMKLTELAESLEAFGKKSISLASGLLKGNKRE